LLLRRFSHSTTGRRVGCSNMLPVKGAGLALVKIVRQREAPGFSKKVAREGFSQESSGGSLLLHFLAFNGGRHGRCSGAGWFRLPGSFTQVPPECWLLQTPGLLWPVVSFPTAPFATVGYYHLWVLCRKGGGSVGCGSPNRRLSLIYPAPAGVMARVWGL
jgi:hypothetical protein